MRILTFRDSRKPKGIEISALMGVPEFAQLAGNIENLCVFATKTITEPSSVIKTGARHSYAKYLLFPVKLRRLFKGTDFEFEKIVCGTVEYKDALYVVFGVRRKASTIEKGDDGS